MVSARRPKTSADPRLSSTLLGASTCIVISKERVAM